MFVVDWSDYLLFSYSSTFFLGSLINETYVYLRLVRERERETDRQTDKQADRWLERETETERDREIDREGEISLIW